MKGWVATLTGAILRRPGDAQTRPNSVHPPRGGLTIALVRVAVLASSVALMLPGAWGNSVTVVEFAQLPAGLAAWQRSSLGIYRVCGPMSKLLYALPAHMGGIRTVYPPSFDTDVETRREWELGEIFQAQHSRSYHAIYRWSRLLPILMTILCGCLVSEWSTRLFGTWPGVASLCACCWMPPILAHGSLLTSDMPSTVALVVSARLFWSFLMDARARTAVFAGLALGVAAATKFTLLILYPCWSGLLIARAFQMRRNEDDESREGARRSIVRWTGYASLMIAVSILAIDSLYLFQGMGTCLSDWGGSRSSLSRVAHSLGQCRATAWLLRVPLPLPIEFVRGLDVQLADTERLQSAYLLGETRLGGWWYWYAVATLIKTPIPCLIIFALSFRNLADLVRSPNPNAWAALCLLIPALEIALVITATTGTGSNAAFRYLIPALALLCVWAGRSFSYAGSAPRWAGGALLVWLAADAVTAAPDLIGWQNVMARSVAGGQPALIGDSLDWGQDLNRLSDWISTHADEGSTLICVYGPGSGEPYGLMPPVARPTSKPGENPVYLAVSQNVLHGYEGTSCVRVASGNSSLNPEQRALLAGRPPLERVGRTINVYRLRDVWPVPNSRENSLRAEGN